jgi:type I restriction enzyme S subunit
MSKAAWKRVKLGEVCRIEKGATGIMKAIPGEYPMVTLAADRTSHNEYQFDAKAVIVPLVSSTGHGHASMKRIHYQEGKFALGSILCALIPHDEQIVHPHFLFTYLNFAREQVFVPLMRGAANVSLSVKNIASVEILLPPLDEQKRIAAHIERITACSQALRHELATQKTLLAKLREAILREAVQGKLTHQSADNEDASHLLARIKAEKAAKGIKEKPLAPIKPEEIPYQLPQGWVWCRLGEICEKIGSGSTPRGGNAVYTKAGVKFLRSQNVYNDGLRLDDVVYISEEIHERMSGTKINPLDILLNITGGSIGRITIVPASFIDGNINQHVTIIRPVSTAFSDFVHKILLSPNYQEMILDEATGAGREGLPKNRLELFPIPLPPLAEQERIVAAVERLLGRVSALEKEVLQEQVTLGRLMQSALREAFGGGAVENERGDEHEI